MGSCASVLNWMLDGDDRAVCADDNVRGLDWGPTGPMRSHDREYREAFRHLQRCPFIRMWHARPDVLHDMRGPDPDGIEPGDHAGLAAS